MSATSKSLNAQRWLDAYIDPHAGIYTFSHCITLADLQADGDHKLIIADLGTGSSNVKLKVYKGTSLMTESALLDVSTGIVSFHMNAGEPHVPAVAVASGSSVYIYKNMRPYFKYSLPQMEVNSLEQDLWIQIREQAIEVEVFFELLQNLKQEIGFTNLTSRSQQLLMLDHTKWADFIDQYKNIPIKRQTVITTITTLKMNMAEEDAVACLVIGTENGDIYILDPEAFTVLHSMNLNGESTDGVMNLIPVHISTSGLFDIEFRIVCVCRKGSICIVRRGWKESKILTQLASPAVAIVLMQDTGSIVAALMDQTIQCFSKKGKKQWEMTTSKTVSTMAPLPLTHQSVTLLIVALNGGTVHIYSGRQLVDVISTSDTVSAIRFGRFGQEEHSLIMVTMGGCLMVKILKRTATFTPQVTSAGPVAAQQVKMMLPKKTKLFIEQTMRERDNSVVMHQTFQYDLLRLRLNAAQECVKSLKSFNNPISNSMKEPLKMSAQVIGLGPRFKILFTLENLSTAAPSQDLAIVLHCDEKLYRVEQPFIFVPFLVPGLTYKFDTVVECVSDLGLSDSIRIFIIKINCTDLMLAVVINMPSCDMLTAL